MPPGGAEALLGLATVLPLRMALASCSVSPSGAMPSSPLSTCTHRSYCLSALLRLPEAASNRISSRCPSSRSGSRVVSALAAATAPCMSPVSARMKASRCRRSRRSDESRWRSSESQSLNGSTGTCRPAKKVVAVEGDCALHLRDGIREASSIERGNVDHPLSDGVSSTVAISATSGSLASAPSALRTAARHCRRLWRACSVALLPHNSVASCSREVGRPRCMGKVGEKCLRLLWQAKHRAVAALDLEGAKKANSQAPQRAGRPRAAHVLVRGWIVTGRSPSTGHVAVNSIAPETAAWRPL